MHATHRLLSEVIDLMMMPANGPQIAVRYLCGKNDSLPGRIYQRSTKNIITKDVEIL